MNGRYAKAALATAFHSDLRLSRSTVHGQTDDDMPDAGLEWDHLECNLKQLLAAHHLSALTLFDLSATRTAAILPAICFACCSSDSLHHQRLARDNASRPMSI